MYYQQEQLEMINVSCGMCECTALACSIYYYLTGFTDRADDSRDGLVTSSHSLTRYLISSVISLMYLYYMSML